MFQVPIVPIYFLITTTQKQYLIFHLYIKFNPKWKWK